MEISSVTQQQKVVAVAFLALVLFGFFIFGSRSSEDQLEFDDLKVIETVTEKQVDEAGSYVFVEISGQVKNPGVYEVLEGTLVIELVGLAGGYLESVDMQYVHKSLPLARKVVAEEKIYIPSGTEFLHPVSISSQDQGKVSINNATVEQLMNLPGVGEVTAKKIVEARPFAEVEGLQQVDGIGSKTYSDISSKVTL